MVFQCFSIGSIGFSRVFWSFSMVFLCFSGFPMVLYFVFFPLFFLVFVQGFSKVS